MISGKTFLVFGDDFGIHPTSTEHVLRHLMRENQFIWVHLMGSRAPQLHLHDLRRASQKLRQWIGATPRPFSAPSVTFYSPMVIPLNVSHVVRALNRRIVIRGVRRLLSDLGVQRPILVASVPPAAEVIGEFGEDLVAYICEDEYSELPGVFRDYVAAMDAIMLDHADVTFVTSEPLRVKKSRPGKPTHLLLQGVDFDHFSQAWHTPTPLPSELARLPRPIIGLIGTLDKRLDVELVRAAARAFPTASVVLIGTIRIDLTDSHIEPNIFILGPRRYADLPRYLAAFSVGLIPYRARALTEYVNPLKLLEYFAAGLPVVTAGLCHLPDYGGLVYHASTTQQFISFVGSALTEHDGDYWMRRVALAQQNTWADRAALFSEQLLAALSSSRPQPLTR